MTITERLGEFVTGAAPPSEARDRAAVAVLDTVGVILAGAGEPASRIVQAVVASEGGDACRVFGTTTRASASGAAFTNCGLLPTTVSTRTAGA